MDLNSINYTGAPTPHSVEDLCGDSLDANELVIASEKIGVF